MKLRSSKLATWLSAGVMIAATAALVVACGGGDNTAAPTTAQTTVPPSNNTTNVPSGNVDNGGNVDPGPTGVQRVKHVFVITLENKNYEDTFSTSTQDPYLTGTLKPMGAMLTQYYGTGHASLDNYISMISGQPSTVDTQGDCTSYNDFVQKDTTADGFPVGNGCVYPATVKTLPDQLKAKNLTWKGYMEDMGNDPTREKATCAHPQLGATDLTNTPEPPSAAVPLGDQYATRHNPFMYFHSIIDSTDCDTNVVALNKLDADLASAATTPNFVFITPQVCSDGHDGDGTGAVGKGCVDGKPGGLTSADAFLKTWVPKILASEAYKKDGLLIINFDESAQYSQVVSQDPTSGKTRITVTFKGDSCCGQQMGPNVTRPATSIFPISATMEYALVMEGWGGDRTGAVLISPFIKPGTVTDTPYNHYSMLKSLEDIFGINEYLGYAKQAGLTAFGSDIFTN